MSNHIMSITKFRRPSTTIDWSVDLVEDEKLLPYINGTYFDSGQILDRTTILSEDQLVKTIKTLWIGNDLRNAYTKDPIVRVRNLINKQYYNEVGIEATWENIEYVDNTETELKRWSGTFNDTRHLGELTQ